MSLAPDPVQELPKNALPADPIPRPQPKAGRPPPKPRVLEGVHFMSGDHACAEGALAAGLNFFGGYPITPSTEIAERLAVRMPEIGGVFAQMEDEIASMASIIGASVAGARAMTATSGPGFSLMMENIGLAVMMEAPCVVINVQRGSTSTGLPTLVGQADVMQARFGSHGDYGIVAYAPCSPQECFDLTIKAFNTADAYRIPVFVMADEVIGHMTERVIIPAAGQIPFIGRKGPSVKPGPAFRAFQADESLVPPMAHAGEGYRVHFTSLTHDERGHPSMTAAAHDRLVRRLVDKVEKHADQLVEYEALHLDDAEIVVISFGCTARSAREAVNRARRNGIRAGMLRLITLWPFPEKIVRCLAETSKSRQFIVAEINLGQMAREVERCALRPVIRINHAGGKVIEPEMILNAIVQHGGKK
jgi:2-oxoglutarate/2-oxoacid ferredoxin oxidoreductase subunit alpha